jgi:undecaprenyl-diphosphatase
VLEGDSRALDEWVLLHLRTPAHKPIGFAGLPEIARDLTALGSPAVLILVTGAAWLSLILAQQRAMAWVTLGSVLSGLGITVVLKNVFARSRPDAIYHAAVAAGYSFPSGHAMMSAVVYLTLSVLIARTTRHAALRRCAVAIAALLSLLVGLTRIYLGVHWTSDVVGGWIVGAAWALGCWLMAERVGAGTKGGR